MKKTAIRLSNKIKKLSKKVSTSKGVVLMYHRISDSYLDPWNLNVSGYNFQDHLKLFNKNYNVLPLREFNELRITGGLPCRSLAITFDDGYADNAVVAAPMMRAAGLPATFFICTGTLGRTSGMWWDTLAQMVFGGHALPHSEKLEYERIVKELLISNANSLDSMKNSMKCIEQISMRDMYMQLWRKIQPMPIDVQQYQLEMLGTQLDFNETKTNPMMLDADVRQLNEDSLFEVGAHTQNHIQLPAHSIKVQKLEIQQNVEYLENLTSQSVHSMSYPFGSYNRNTLVIAKQSGFAVACTTVPDVATRIDNSLLLPRVMVNNVSSETLQAEIERYFK